MSNAAGVMFAAGIFCALGIYPRGTWVCIALGFLFTIGAAWQEQQRQRRIARAEVALMQAQAEMNAEALVRAIRRERE